MTTMSRRPSWTKRRWTAALLLWLAFAYPASLPPLVWIARHRWFPNLAADALELAYAPLEWACYPEPTFGFGWYRQVVEYVGDL